MSVEAGAYLEGSCDTWNTWKELQQVEAGAYLEGSHGLPTPIPRASRAGLDAYSATARIGAFLSPAAVVGFLIQ